MVLSKIALIWLSALIIAQIVTPVTSRECYAEDPQFVGSGAKGVVEATLAKHSIPGAPNIWPRDEVIAKGERPDLDDAFVKWLEGWFGKVVDADVAPVNGDWNRSSWLLIPKLHRQSDYVVGFFPSQDKRISRVEFQVERSDSERALYITYVFRDDLQLAQLNEKLLRDTFSAVLNIPDDTKTHLEVNAQRIMMDGSGKVLIHGKLLDARKKDPQATVLRASTRGSAALPPTTPDRFNEVTEFRPLIPHDEREWFSPLDFWCADNKLCLRVYTVDWKSGDRPMGIHADGNDK
jgi:hypothetical protein